MGKVFVFSDVHGNYDSLMEALRDCGIVDGHGNRQLPRKDKVFSIGDLINGVESSYSGDNKCLDLVGPIIDGIIVGNHEIPYFDPANTFSGFHSYEHISDRLWNLLDKDLIGPCLLVGDILISHAGVHESWNFPTASDASIKMETEWQRKNFGHFLFSSVGLARGGRDIFGGALWCDFDRELQSSFPQIVGHTPGILRYKENALCIDVGAKTSGKPVVIEVR